MIDLNRLKSQLATAKVRESDFALFQVVNQLIDVLRQSNKEIIAEIASSGGGGGVTTLTTRTYLTVDDETGSLINSRRMLAGIGISFDDSVSGERTISSTVTGGSQWSVLTDGDIEETELIYAGGEVIMLEIAA